MLSWHRQRRRSLHLLRFRCSYPYNLTTNLKISIHSTHSVPQVSQQQWIIGCFGSVSSIRTLDILFEEHSGHITFTSYVVPFSFSCLQQQVSWSISHHRCIDNEPIFRLS
ncbi:MAG: hypothetical protein [Circular genetic element sp.]|nr:MAG: hypothetical protein [Circular genetic element sp.]